MPLRIREKPESTRQLERTNPRPLPARLDAIDRESGRCEDARRPTDSDGRWPAAVRRRSESPVALQHGHDASGEHAHVELRLFVRHSAVAELADQMVETGKLLQLGDLLDAVVWRADHLDLDVELRRLLSEALVLHLGIRLRYTAVELVTLHRGQMAVGEVVVGVDRVPLARQVLRGALVGLLAG